MVLNVQSKDDKDIYEIIRDSAVQRFEYSIDTFWKFLKLYMEVKNKSIFESAAPRVILREAVSQDIITQEEFVLLLEFLGERNLTSHSYNEILAEKLVSTIPLSYKIMNNIINRISL